MTKLGIYFVAFCEVMFALFMLACAHQIIGWATDPHVPVPVLRVALVAALPLFLLIVSLISAVGLVLGDRRAWWSSFALGVLALLIGVGLFGCLIHGLPAKIAHISDFVFLLAIVHVVPSMLGLFLLSLRSTKSHIRFAARELDGSV
jgi:hypothetical protein